jgi:hypothetical protein
MILTSPLFIHGRHIPSLETRVCVWEAIKQQEDRWTGKDLEGSVSSLIKALCNLPEWTEESHKEPVKLACRISQVRFEPARPDYKCRGFLPHQYIWCKPAMESNLKETVQQQNVCDTRESIQIHKWLLESSNDKTFLLLPQGPTHSSLQTCSLQHHSMFYFNVEDSGTPIGLLNLGLPS